MVSAAPSGRESYRTLGAGVAYRAAVKSRGAGGIAETGAFARRLSICSRAAQPSPLTEPEHCTRYPRRGQAHPVPSAKRRARGRRGQSPRIPSPPPQRVGSCPRRTRPTRGAEASARRPQKGRQRYKTVLLRKPVSGRGLRKRCRPFCLFACEGRCSTRPDKAAHGGTGGHGRNGAREGRRARSGGGRARSAPDGTASS